MTTKRLFETEPYASTCTAVVLAVSGKTIVLDRTVAYARSGGQVGDSGWIITPGGGRIPFGDTIYDADKFTVLHQIELAEARIRPDDCVTLEIDWVRRHRLMRMHTCLHLLCALVDAPVTGCSIANGYGRLDFDLPDSLLDRTDLEKRLNALVASDTEVIATCLDEAELDAQPELVRTLRVSPPRGRGPVRLIEIVGIDRQPCGGTHVRRTGEIGPVTITKVEKKSRHNRRVTVVLL